MATTYRKLLKKLPAERQRKIAQRTQELVEKWLDAQLDAEEQEIEAYLDIDNRLSPKKKAQELAKLKAAAKRRSFAKKVGCEPK